MRWCILAILGSCFLFMTWQASAMMCTMDYAPVCGMSPQKACLSLDCASQQRTYSNKCMLESDGAEFLHEGECKKTLPEATNSKYYVWNTKQCQIMKYTCESGWEYFGDDVWCGCIKKQYISEENRVKIDTILNDFFKKLEIKWYSNTKITSLINLIEEKLIKAQNTKPKLKNTIDYILWELDKYKDNYK